MGACSRQRVGRGQGSRRAGLGGIRHSDRAGGDLFAQSRQPADGRGPQAPARPPAPHRDPVAGRAQGTRRHHPQDHRLTAGVAEEGGRGAPFRVPARQELGAADGEVAAGRDCRELGPRRAEGPGFAPPEQGCGRVEDSPG